MIRRLGLIWALSAITALGAPDAGYAQASLGLCGNPHDNGAAFGPFDYRTATPYQRGVVESFHFTPSVETLRKGESGTLGGDLHYTLNVFPNHPRALYAITRLAARQKTNQPTGAKFLIECYYDRAIRFAPDDAAVRVLYAHFLIERNRGSEAKPHLVLAEHGADDPQVAYNLGLAWVSLGDNEKALQMAKRAYDAGLQFPGLRDKLKAAGAWRE